MKSKFLLALTLVTMLTSFAQAENTVSYYESKADHDDYVLLVLQSGDYRSFKICDRSLLKAGVLDYTNPKHCSQIGKPAYQYLNTSMILYKSKAEKAAAAANRKSDLGWAGMWTSIAVPTVRTIYQYFESNSYEGFREDRNLTMGQAIGKNKFWLLGGATIAVITGYYGSLQGEIQNNAEVVVNALSPATSPVLTGQTAQIDMPISDYAKMLNTVLVQLETQGLIKGQSI